MKMFQLKDNVYVPTMMNTRDKMFLGQPSTQMTSSGGSGSVIGPNSVPSSSNSSSASFGVHPASSLFVPVMGHPSMMPYMRPIFHAPMTYDASAPPYFATLVPVPMGSGMLSEYINPRHTRRIMQAQFAHQYPMGRANSSYKTVMCQSWLETAICKFGEECKFAHGEHELRDSIPPMRNPNKYKTRLCEKYTVRGCCPYGNRCLFIHPEPSQMLGVPPPAGVGMTLDTYKNYVVVPQPQLMLATSPFPDETSIESTQFHYRMVEAPVTSESTTKNVSPTELTPLPSSPQSSVCSAGGAVSTKEPVSGVVTKLAAVVIEQQDGEGKQQAKDCKQMFRDMLHREDQQRNEAADKKIDTDPTEEKMDVDEPTDNNKKSSQMQQNVSFNESGQTERLAYTLANVLDTSQ